MEGTPTPSVQPYLTPFRSSTRPQSEELKSQLKQLMQVDPYNRFCVDCLHSHSSHASLAYGIFVCGECADFHKNTLAVGRVKEVFKEQWDDPQLAVLIQGGNQKFFDFLNEYHLQNTQEVSLDKRYRHEAVKYYARRLNAVAVDRQLFTEKQPAKDWDERVTRAKSAVLDWVDRNEKKIQNLGDKIDQDLEKTDWKTRIEINKKTVKDTDKLVFTGSMGDALAKSTLVENPIQQQDDSSQLMTQVQKQQEDEPKSFFGFAGGQDPLTLVPSMIPSNVEINDNNEQVQNDEEPEQYVLEEDGFEGMKSGDASGESGVHYQF